MMPVIGYDIEAARPVAPSEAPRNRAALYRRSLGGFATGGAVGAGLGAYLSKHNPTYTGLAGGLGAGLGVLHGVLKSRESRLGDQTTQERMEMRRALSEFKKQQKAKERMNSTKVAFDGVALRAMQEELLALSKESSLEKEAFPVAAIGNALGRVGKTVMSGAGKGLTALGSKGGRVGQAANKARSSLFKGTLGATQRLGGGTRGMGRLQKVVGGAAIGAGALGAKSALS